MARIFVMFLLVLSGAVLAGAQQPQSEDQQDSQPTEQKVITDPAEYNAYITALNTLDPAARKAAFDAFLEKYPNSVLRDEAFNLAMDAVVQFDNQESESVRQQLLGQPQPIPQKAGLTPAERACKVVLELHRKLYRFRNGNLFFSIAIPARRAIVTAPKGLANYPGQTEVCSGQACQDDITADSCVLSNRQIYRWGIDLR